LIDGALSGQFPILVHDAPRQPEEDPGGHQNGGQEKEDLPLVAVNVHLAQLPEFYSFH
jgi:hypothetical protein